MKVRTHVARIGRLADSLSSAASAPGPRWVNVAKRSAALALALCALAAAPAPSDVASHASPWSMSLCRLSWPPVSIGGWALQTMESATYDPDSGIYDLNIARVTGGVGPQATTLWAAVVDESPDDDAEIVETISFAPAQLPLNQVGVVIEGKHTLPAGHTLRLRVFEQEPLPGDATSGALLWES